MINNNNNQPLSLEVINKSKHTVNISRFEVESARKFIGSHTTRLRYIQLNKGQDELLMDMELKALAQHVRDTRKNIVKLASEKVYQIYENVLDNIDPDDDTLRAEVREFNDELEKYHHHYREFSLLFQVINHEPRVPIETKTMKDICAICMKKHRQFGAIQLICGHQFGRKCFDSFCKKRANPRTPVKCPICRRENV